MAVYFLNEDKNDDPKIASWAKKMKKSLEGYGEKKLKESYSNTTYRDLIDLCKRVDSSNHKDIVDEIKAEQRKQDAFVDDVADEKFTKKIMGKFGFAKNESLKESKNLKEYFDIYDRDVVYWTKDTLDMDKSMTKEEFIDEFTSMYPASRRDAEGAYDSWKDGVLDQYVKEWEDGEENESLKEDVFRDWKPDTSWRHIADIMKKVEARGYEYRNNEREEIKAALDLADKGKYSPTNRSALRNFHQEVWRRNRNRGESLKESSLNEEHTMVKEEIEELDAAIAEAIHQTSIILKTHDDKETQDLMRKVKDLLVKARFTY